MSRNKDPAEYTLELKDDMEEFIKDFWEEFNRQKNLVNKSSEIRMRKLLRNFETRVEEPYRTKSLKKGAVNLKNLLEEEEDFDGY